MAKHRKTGQLKAAKGAPVNSVSDTSIPPIYYTRPKGAPPDPEPDPQRGALTEGKSIVHAFSELIREGKAGQYLILDRARMRMPRRQPIRRYPNPPTSTLLTKERDGELYTREGGLAYHPNRDMYPARRRRRDPYGATFHRVTRTLIWRATIYRLATEEEIDNRVRDLGKRRGNIAKDLLNDTREWYKIRQPDPGVEPPAEELRRFRVEAYGLPDMADKDLLKHYHTRPLPLWYTWGVSWDDHTATGPNDARYPVEMIGADFLPTNNDTSDEEIYRQWISEFAAEVEECVKRHEEDDELPHELNRLIDNLQAFKIGDGMAAPFIEVLRADEYGKPVMRMMDEGKVRLLRRLHQLRNAHTSRVTPRSNRNGPSSDRTAASLSDEFARLLAEGKASQYALLALALIPTWKEIIDLIDRSMWEGFVDELNGSQNIAPGITDEQILELLNADWAAPVGLFPPVEERIERQRTFFTWLNNVAAEMEKVTPTMEKSFAHNTTSIADRYGRWSAIYVDEVKAWVERFREDNELPLELARLIQRLRNFVIGKAEAGPFMAAIGGTGIGQSIMATMNDGKDRLLEQLNEVSKNLASKAVVTTSNLKRTKGLTIPVIARICWCMTSAGQKDHRIVNRSAANRLALLYGQSNSRAGETLKREWNRFSDSDGEQFLKYGKGSNHSHGQKMWDAVKVELMRLGEKEASERAETMLSDI